MKGRPEGQNMNSVRRQTSKSRQSRAEYRSRKWPPVKEACGSEAVRNPECSTRRPWRSSGLALYFPGGLGDLPKVPVYTGEGGPVPQPPPSAVLTPHTPQALKYFQKTTAQQSTHSTTVGPQVDRTGVHEGWSHQHQPPGVLRSLCNPERGSWPPHTQGPLCPKSCSAPAHPYRRGQTWTEAGRGRTTSHWGQLPRPPAWPQLGLSLHANLSREKYIGKIRARNEAGKPRPQIQSPRLMLRPGDTDIQCQGTQPEFCT